MEPVKPFYDSKFMFSKVMNKSIKHACRIRLEVLLADEERSFARWQDVTRRLMNATRQQQVERNYYKRINALKVVCWMLSDFGERTGDLPSLVTKRKKDLAPKKEPKLLAGSTTEQMPVLSQDSLNMLVNLAKMLNPKQNNS